ncbi:MAG: SDR family oxidoreductase [Caldilineaceae bacterium]|nr:SDR family oxidoreductase [Caldilineaceae bacterium]
MDFTKQCVIVTGGASGMGAATARLFAAAGAQTVIVDRNAALAREIAAELGIDEPLIGDVADSTFCERCVQTAVARHGRLDVLVNAAGTILRADALNTSDEEWLRVMHVNTNGLFFMSRAAVRVMKQQGSGAIVNFGSIWGGVGGKGHVAYCASKGAVHQITRAMALDHARDGIRINGVCPGEIDTPMLRLAGRTDRLSDEAAAQMADTVIPMGRLGQPEEVARVVVFLASAEASYITGALVPVDAGYTTM